MGKLDGKIAVVTGGSSGIGLATASRLVADGAYVFITGRREPEAALRSFARTWTSDLKARKIRVNVVSPGAIDTPGLRGLNKLDSDGLAEQFRDRVPLGRVGYPDDIANVVAFLASDDAGYIAGSELFVDGGLAQV
jgi:NAD(P)-dependent dehydrogenase (short-subunit alcohol dehydrogenase family)